MTKAEKVAFANLARKLHKFQTNLNQGTIDKVDDIAIREDISAAAVVRRFVLEGIQRYNGAKVVEETGIMPESCPNCGESRNEIDEPVLVISGRNWSCHECGARGTW